MELNSMKKGQKTSNDIIADHRHFVDRLDPIDLKAKKSLPL